MPRALVPDPSFAHYCPCKGVTLWGLPTGQEGAFLPQPVEWGSRKHMESWVVRKLGRLSLGAPASLPSPCSL